MSEHDNDQIVSDFCAAWGRGDKEAILGAFAPDAVYHNIPMDPAEGIDAIAAVIEGFMAMGGGIRFETTNQVTSGDLVMNERVDHIEMPGRTVSLPVMGVFELADGKITAWRDYFDMGQFTGAG